MLCLAGFSSTWRPTRASMRLRQQRRQHLALKQLLTSLTGSSQVTFQVHEQSYCNCSD